MSSSEETSLADYLQEQPYILDSVKDNMHGNSAFNRIKRGLDTNLAVFSGQLDKE